MAQKRLLIIDDDPDIQAITEMGLTLLTEWSVLKASSGAQGIAIARQESVDAIVLDVMMPEMDGYETLKQLRSNPETQSIPVIFLTAKVQASDRRNLYAAGAQGMITKPFDPLTLASQIAGFLGWSLPQSSP